MFVNARKSSEIMSSIGQIDDRCAYEEHVPWHLLADTNQCLAAMATTDKYDRQLRLWGAQSELHLDNLDVKTYVKATNI